MAWPRRRIDFEWAAGRWYDLMERVCDCIEDSAANIEDASKHHALRGACDAMLVYLAWLVPQEPEAGFFDAKFVETMQRVRAKPGEDLMALAPDYYALRDGVSDISAWCSMHAAEVFAEQQPQGAAAPEYPPLVDPRRAELLAILTPLLTRMGD